MTRRALLLAAGAAIWAGPADGAQRRRILRARPPAPKPAAPDLPEPPRKTVRTIRLDTDWQPHMTFEQRWAGE